MITDQPLAWREWDGEYVVYNPLSGSTHLLDLVSGKVLKAIEAAEAPPDTSTVCARIAAFLEIEPGPQVEENVTAILTRLDELGLIAPV